jgi:Ni,Fe-hydrogenase I cytochrome b subunit
MDNKTWIIIVLVTVLVGIGLYIGYGYISNDIYTKGVTDGAKYLNQQVMNQVLSNGNLVLTIPYQNKTYEVVMVINQTKEIKK